MRRFPRGPGFRIEQAGGHDILRFVCMLVFIAAVVGLTILLVTYIRRSHHVHGVTPSSAPTPPLAPKGPPDPALLEARMRYARGELSRDRYIEIASDLGDPTPFVPAAPEYSQPEYSSPPEQSAAPETPGAPEPA